MPILAARRRARPSSLSVAEIGAEHGDAAFESPARDPAITMSSVDLPEPERPTTAIDLAGRHVHVQSAQYGDGTGAGGKRDMHVFEPDGGGRGLFQSLIHGTGSRS